MTSSPIYQKGSWTLHILRGVVGGYAFRRDICIDYQRHLDGSVTAADFRRAMDEASGRELGWCFERWHHKPGRLRIAGHWTCDARARQVSVLLKQVQGEDNLIRMPLEVGVYVEGQTSPTIEGVQLDAKSHVFTINSPSEPDDVRLDPNAWVLMDATVVKRT